ncbi:hypothetical protein FKG94_06910 [Exilibacterium tricleocarpae]|uniref:DUF4386 family protein n=1 Tax=Exilibacterium tricleocarpae TaxID=2591008 RepID=A0A545TZ25_9GAMM|nr:hypothetical protein [Exilibacterium tricleocarpae]TQV82466.1 hypothetical protein FKG94_06910 [Exilibacterium tricleocarpae]
MTSRQNALWFSACAAFLSAVTTFLLWYLPRQYASPANFEEAVALHQNAFYMARLWVNYIHVFLALAAYAGVTYLCYRRAPVLALAGFIAFAFWAFAEALGVAINIWGVNELWRAGYAGADSETQTLIRTSINTFTGIWEGLFFVVLTTFLIGTLSLGMALWHGDTLQRALAILFLLAGPLTLIIMLDGYFGASLSPWIAWSYPVLQPLSHALMGGWLARAAYRAGLA